MLVAVLLKRVSHCKLSHEEAEKTTANHTAPAVDQHAISD